MAGLGWASVWFMIGYDIGTVEVLLTWTLLHP